MDQTQVAASQDRAEAEASRIHLLGEAVARRGKKKYKKRWWGERAPTPTATPDLKYEKTDPANFLASANWPGSSDAERRLRKAASQPMSGMPGAGRRGALAASQCGEQMACTDMSPHGNSNPHFL